VLPNSKSFGIVTDQVLPLSKTAFTTFCPLVPIKTNDTPAEEMLPKTVALNLVTPLVTVSPLIGAVNVKVGETSVTSTEILFESIFPAESLTVTVMVNEGELLGTTKLTRNVLSAFTVGTPTPGTSEPFTLTVKEESVPANHTKPAISKVLPD